jgi:hypothetical protein
VQHIGLQIEQVAALVALVLAVAVPLYGVGVRGGPVLLPIAGVSGPPLAGAFAADLTILGVRNQFLRAAISAAALLAGRSLT